jgi:hypothetical protein
VHDSAKSDVVDAVCVRPAEIDRDGHDRLGPRLVADVRGIPGFAVDVRVAHAR